MFRNVPEPMTLNLAAFCENDLDFLVTTVVSVPETFSEFLETRPRWARKD
jgi:hypothetical protein